MGLLERLIFEEKENRYNLIAWLLYFALNAILVAIEVEVFIGW